MQAVPTKVAAVRDVLEETARKYPDYYFEDAIHVSEPGPQQKDHWCICDNFDGRYFVTIFRYYPATDSWKIGRSYGETDGRDADFDEVFELASCLLDRE